MITLKQAKQFFFAGGSKNVSNTDWRVDMCFGSNLESCLKILCSTERSQKNALKVLPGGSISEMAEYNLLLHESNTSIAKNHPNKLFQNFGS